MDNTQFPGTDDLSGELLPQADLARRWKTSARTLARWRAQGCGPAYIRIGGRILYRLSDILAFENQMRNAGATSP